MSRYNVPHAVTHAKKASFFGQFGEGDEVKNKKKRPR
jgi:hypothetical protein